MGLAACTTLVLLVQCTPADSKSLGQVQTKASDEGESGAAVQIPPAAVFQRADALSIPGSHMECVAGCCRVTCGTWSSIAVTGRTRPPKRCAGPGARSGWAAGFLCACGTMCSSMNLCLKQFPGTLAPIQCLKTIQHGPRYLPGCCRAPASMSRKGSHGGDVIHLLLCIVWNVSSHNSHIHPHPLPPRLPPPLFWQHAKPSTATPAMQAP